MEDLADILAHLDDTLHNLRIAHTEIKATKERTNTALRANPVGGGSCNAPYNFLMGGYELYQAIKHLEAAACDIAIEIACATLPDDADATGLYEETIVRVVRERRAA